jgi:hypothetical protein
MSEPFHASAACLSSYPVGRLYMYGMKGLLSVLDVKTDRIHHTISADNGIGDGPFIVDVGLDRLEMRIIEREQTRSPIRMP